MMDVMMERSVMMGVMIDKEVMMTVMIEISDNAWMS